MNPNTTSNTRGLSVVTPGIIPQITEVLFRFVARYTSYVYAVSIFSAGMAGLTGTIFALYYFDAINVPVSESFMSTLKTMIVLYWILIMFQYGLLGRLGFTGVGKHVNIVNKFVISHPEIHLKEDMTDDDCKELFKSIVALPGYFAFNLFIWILVLVLFIIIVGVFVEGFNLSVVASIVIIGFITLFNIVCLTLVISEVFTGAIREKCKKILFDRKIQFRDRSLSTVKIKFIFFLILLSIALFLSNIVTYYNHGELTKVISFAMIALFVSMVMAYLIFNIIYSALKQIESAAYDLMKGGAGVVFLRSLDKEFINVATGINRAAKTIREYQLGLEEKVNQRTQELNKAYSDLAKKEDELNQELEIARDIQRGIIPDETDLNSWNGISFSAFYYPMGSVSGDYYDVFRFSRDMYILIADVSGHGVPAALITMTAKQAFSSVIKEGIHPHEVFKEVNLAILERVKTTDYLSAFLIRIDEKNRISYSNAAHPKAIHYVYARDEYVLLDSEGMFIGAMEEASYSYETRETRLQSGDRLYLYTDGIFEHKNMNGELYGMDRMLAFLRKCKNEPINIQINQLYQNVKEFIGKAPIKDDISMIAIELEPRWAKFIDLYNAGIKLLKNKRPEESIRKLNEAMQIIPSYSAVQFQMALAYYHLGNLDISEELVKKYIMEKPGDKKGIQLLVNILTKLDRRDEVNYWMAKLNEIFE